jgi:hypothetical protein
MHCELKKGAVAYFKLIPETEKNHNKINVACVLIDNRSTQDYHANTIKMFFC